MKHKQKKLNITRSHLVSVVSNAFDIQDLERKKNETNVKFN